MSHEHKHSCCLHECLHYCTKCDKVYCCQCGRTWGDGWTYYPWTYIYPYNASSGVTIQADYTTVCDAATCGHVHG